MGVEGTACFDEDNLAILSVIFARWNCWGVSAQKQEFPQQLQDSEHVLFHFHLFCAKWDVASMGFGVWKLVAGVQDAVKLRGELAKINWRARSLQYRIYLKATRDVIIVHSVYFLRTVARGPPVWILYKIGGWENGDLRRQNPNFPTGKQMQHPLGMRAGFWWIGA